MVDRFKIVSFPEHIFLIAGNGTREEPYRYRCSWCGVERELPVHRESCSLTPSQYQWKEWLAIWWWVGRAYNAGVQLW